MPAGIESCSVVPADGGFRLHYDPAIAVPLNTLFGVFCALLLVRRSFPGKSVLNVLIDVPFAVSPVVVGLALVLVMRFKPAGLWPSPERKRELGEKPAGGA